MKKRGKTVANIQTDKEFDRENYLHNRDIMLEDFHSNLKEVQRDKPSLPGKIAGMDYQQFAAKAIFRDIKEQEEYIITATKYRPHYVDVREEKNILHDMRKAAMKVFGETYQDWYLSYGDGSK